MSLVRPLDSSSTSYSDPNSIPSSQLFTNDNRTGKYGPVSFYDQQHSTTSSGSMLKFGHPSMSNTISGHAFQSKDYLPYRHVSVSNSSITDQSSKDTAFAITRNLPPDQSLDLDMGSPDEMSYYKEEDIRFKLEELERVLLDDNIEDLLNLDEGMIVDGNWADPITDLLLPLSPKESSSGSNVSSLSSRTLPRTPKQLLFDCAAAMSEGDMKGASTLISELRQTVSIQGDPPQRIAAYMVEGLAARMAASGQGLYKALRCKEPPDSDRLSAMQILFEICPCFKFGFMAANGAILEAVKTDDRVHIIDFDINQGSQYITLIQAFASRPGGPHLLRITGVDDPETVQRAVGGLKVIGRRLENLAEVLGVPFEFRAVAAKTGEVSPSIFGCRPNEALIVNFAFQLHHMPDESVSTVNQRDRLLRMVKSLEPKLVTVVEQDVNTNTAPFFPRFVEAYNYYSAVFESLDATLPRESPDRMNVERHCLARDIVNIVACEGEDRIERYEVAGKWRARMNMAGFTAYSLSSNVMQSIRPLLKAYCDRYKVMEEGGAIHFGWENKILIVASAWR